MNSTLKTFLQRLIKRYEGGWVWDKADPGGPTNFGVTWRALAEHRKEPATSASDWAPKVKAMAISEAIDIYTQKYAVAVRYDDLPAGVDATMLDYAVNSGYGRSNRVARRIVGSPDGTALTPVIIDRIKAMPADAFIDAMCNERLAFMKSLKGGAMWQRYGKGWGDRVADLRRYSHLLAKGTTEHPNTAPDLSNVPTPKAEVPKPNKTVEAGSSGTGGLLASIAGYLADIPVTYIVVAVVVIVAVGFAIGVYRDLAAKTAEEKVHI